MQRRCTYCGQVLPEIRLGVRLPELKAHIFDLVQRSGSVGIAPDTLMALAYSNGYGLHESRHPKTLKAHIFQINELIEDQGYRIAYSGGVYWLKNLNTKYNADDDIRKSVAEGFAAIRERKANGGKGWGE
jgi:hypothetical protein